MLSTRTRAKPRGKPPIDLLLVGLRILPTQVLAHHLHAGIEQIERQPERSRGDGRGHALIVAWPPRRPLLPWTVRNSCPAGS